MPELISSFFTALIGGGATIGVVVFALSRWLGSVWEKRINQLEGARLAIETLREKATIDSVARDHTKELQEQLDLLKQEHEKLLVKDEHFHQISQKTYQDLFELKIETYKELNELKLKYEIPILYDTDQLDYKGIDNRNLLYFEKFNNIINHVNSKAIYITPNLQEKVNAFKSQTSTKIHEIEDWINFHSGEVSDSNDAHVIDEYKANEYSQLYKKTTTSRSIIVEQINEDILKISRFIHGESL